MKFLNSEVLKNKLKIQIGSAIERFKEDLPIPFIPSSIILKIKTRGYTEAEKAIDPLKIEAVSQINKYFWWILLGSFLFTFLLSFIFFSLFS